jgi:4-hydroxy-tetrahydrodipicolinate synthase
MDMRRAKMRELQINGVVPIIPTPFSSDDRPDWASLKRLLNFAVGAGVSAVCLPAYASEFYKLSDEERRDVSHEAIRLMDGRLPVLTQVNHPSADYVARTAHELEKAGASGISVAVPRLFVLPERDLLRYFDRILNAITIPLLIQDFNPGGATISADFIRTLRQNHEHFRYVKLEEPLMSEKVRAILDATSGEVGVLEGWGGIYMLELIRAGICGIMPGLAISDVLQIVWNKTRDGDVDGAFTLFQSVLPQITYSLQNMEFYHHAEKALLVKRGILSQAIVREATLTLSTDDLAHIEFLNRQIVEALQRFGLQVRPCCDTSTVEKGSMLAMNKSPNLN